MINEPHRSQEDSRAGRSMREKIGVSSFGGGTELNCPSTSGSRRKLRLCIVERLKERKLTEIPYAEDHPWDTIVLEIMPSGGNGDGEMRSGARPRNRPRSRALRRRETPANNELTVRGRGRAPTVPPRHSRRRPEINSSRRRARAAGAGTLSRAYRDRAGAALPRDPAAIRAGAAIRR